MFPANGNYVAGAVKTLATILSMGGNHIGFVQYPVTQSQTTPTAMLKHRHQLENNFVKAGLSMVNALQILYTKDASTARDGRALWQSGQAVFHTHFSEHVLQESSTAVKEGKLGPCPLAKFADFLGYDETQKPGASARVEQKLVFFIQTESFCIYNFWIWFENDSVVYSLEGNYGFIF